MIYRFDNFTLDTELVELRCGAEPRPVEPQVFSLLVHLIENRDRVVGREELINSVWNGRIVSDATLNSRLNAARRAVGDTGKLQSTIRTIVRRGFRFVAKVDVPASFSKELHSAPDLDLSLPEKPSIAVLPFVDFGGDPEQKFFSEGLVDDIITTLSKLSGLLVIARDSCAAFKDRHVDLRQVARELGVRYVLEGSVRMSGKRTRINVQLTDASGGANIWAERYDRDIGDIFAIQDEITLTLATEMQVHLTEGEQARLQYTTTQNMDAWTYWVKGLSRYRGPVTKDGMGQARKFWECAVALDPLSAPLNAMLGFLHCIDARFAWWGDREPALRTAAAYIEKALGLDPGNADAHRAQSFFHLFQKCHEEAVAEARASIELAPNSADVASMASFVFCCSGLAEEALIEIKKAIRLHPIHPAYFLGHLGNAYRLAGRFDEAIAAFKAYNERSPGFGLVDLVIVYKQMDRSEDAKSEAARLLAIRPRFTVRAWADTQLLSESAQLQSEMAALRESGLPFE